MIRRRKTTNKYIDRLDASTIPVLPAEHRPHFRDTDEAFEAGWRKALEKVAMIDPADVVERKKGEWINERREGLGSFSAECSLCEKRTLGYFHYFYCPNCGNPMKGENDEN